MTIEKSGFKAVDLVVHLGSRAALNGVSMTAAPGAVTMIVGPNGSGKTTLQRALSGDIGYQGRARLDGIEIKEISRAGLARRRGVLAQHTDVAFPFTVGEIVRLGLTVNAAATTQAKAAAFVDAALRKVDLQGFAGRRYDALSGGERQRVQLARVLCQIEAPKGQEGARWLFLDEPVASLDIRHQLHIMTLARRFADEGGGVIAVMHDLNLAAMYGDHIVALKSGRIVADGAPTDIMQASIIRDCFDCPLRPGHVPADSPFILPQSIHPAH